MGNRINADSRAYIHSGGTKYYRIAMVMLNRGGKDVFAMYSNYGPLKGTKNICDHKPCNGGTSSVTYFSTYAGMSSRFFAEVKRRNSRGYEEAFSDGIKVDEPSASDLLTRDCLCGKIGLTVGHFEELIQESEPSSLDDLGRVTTAKGGSLSKEFADHIAETKAKIAADLLEKRTGIKARKKASTDAGAEAPYIPKPPEINRGMEWGSW